MNIRDISQSFRRRWSINLDDTVEFQSFRMRVEHAIEYSGTERYLLASSGLRNSYNMVSGAQSGTNVYQHLADTASYAEAAQLIQNILWAFERAAMTRFPELPKLVELLREAIARSPLADIELVQSADSVSVYPAGAKLLDATLINDSLGLLEKYPAAAKEFEGALHIYLTKDSARYRNLLDNLRRSLEELLRAVLGNDKSLENQKELLLPWLSSHGLHAQITNMFQSLLFGQYSIYQNDAVKHGDKWNNREVEFMLYLTGTFIRLVVVLTNSPTK